MTSLITPPSRRRTAASRARSIWRAVLRVRPVAARKRRCAVRDDTVDRRVAVQVGDERVPHDHLFAHQGRDERLGVVVGGQVPRRAGQVEATPGHVGEVRDPVDRAARRDLGEDRAELEVDAERDGGVGDGHRGRPGRRTDHRHVHGAVDVPEDEVPAGVRHRGHLGDRLLARCAPHPGDVRRRRRSMLDSQSHGPPLASVRRLSAGRPLGTVMGLRGTPRSHSGGRSRAGWGRTIAGRGCPG